MLTFFTFLKDPTSPLSREEQQKKAWQAQSNKNILAKKSAKAFEIEKLSSTKKEKKSSAPGNEQPQKSTDDLLQRE